MLVGNFLRPLLAHATEFEVFEHLIALLSLRIRADAEQLLQIGELVFLDRSISHLFVPFVFLAGSRIYACSRIGNPLTNMSSRFLKSGGLSHSLSGGIGYRTGPFRVQIDNSLFSYVISASLWHLILLLG
jgi:hypothetical protein